MELTVPERITLLNILPPQGDFTTLKLVRQLREALSFNEEENKALKFTQTGQGDKSFVTWNASEAEKIVKNISIGEKMTDLVVKQLKELNKKQELTDQHFTLYEKFVEGVGVPASQLN